MQRMVRHATTADLDRINTIYNQYIVDRHTSFDLEPWSPAKRRHWFERYHTVGRYQVLVATADDSVLGFAASSPFRDKAGYDTSVETTIVLDEQHLGQGIGGELLPALVGQLAQEDVHRAYALIALPNDASVALHAQCGYREVGVLDEVGTKLAAFHSVLIMELRL